MKRMLEVLFMVIAVSLTCSFPVLAAETVVFEPVRAPSMGPEDAPVTIIEIADYM